jgi:hypothetical protein
MGQQQLLLALLLAGFGGLDTGWCHLVLQLAALAVAAG